MFNVNFNANNKNSSASYPFTNFNFSIEIEVDGVSKRVCDAAFAECDGLEMSMEVKTIREGGNNNKQLQLVGPRSLGQLTLKRGMTSTFDLWEWFNKTLTQPALRADAEVVMLKPDKSEAARFILSRCLPVKIKAPALNAKDGGVAVEELTIAYESLELKQATSGAGGGGISASAGASFGASASASVNASASAGASFNAGVNLGG